MRRLALVLLVAGLLAGAAHAALAAVPQKLLGTWGIPSGPTITLKSNGRAIFKLPGGYTETLTVSATTTRVTFGPAIVCSGKGVYSWKRSGRLLTLKPVADKCTERRAFVSGTWKRR